VKGTRPKHEQRRERPHRAANSRPGPCGLRGSLPPLAAGNRSSCFGRVKRFCIQSCMRRRIQLCRQDCIAKGGHSCRSLNHYPRKQRLQPYRCGLMKKFGTSSPCTPSSSNPHRPTSWPKRSSYSSNAMKSSSAGPANTLIPTKIPNYKEKSPWSTLSDLHEPSRTPIRSAQEPRLVTSAWLAHCGCSAVECRAKRVSERR